MNVPTSETTSAIRRLRNAEVRNGRQRLRVPPADASAIVSPDGKRQFFQPREIVHRGMLSGNFVSLRRSSSPSSIQEDAFADRHDVVRTSQEASAILRS